MKPTYVNPLLSGKANEKISHFMAEMALQNVKLTKNEAVVKFIEMAELPKKIS